jgi:hypothetical protein
LNTSESAIGADAEPAGGSGALRLEAGADLMPIDVQRKVVACEEYAHHEMLRELR